MAGVCPFLPSHPVLVDVERVDVDLWFVNGVDAMLSGGPVKR